MAAERRKRGGSTAGWALAQLASRVNDVLVVGPSNIFDLKVLPRLWSQVHPHPACPGPTRALSSRCANTPIVPSSVGLGFACFQITDPVLCEVLSQVDSR